MRARNRRWAKYISFLDHIYLRCLYKSYFNVLKNVSKRLGCQTTGTDHCALASLFTNAISCGLY